MSGYTTENYNSIASVITPEMLDEFRGEFNELMGSDTPQFLEAMANLNEAMLYIYTVGVVSGFKQGFDDGFDAGRSGHALPCCEGYYPDTKNA